MNITLFRSSYLLRSFCSNLSQNSEIRALLKGIKKLDNYTEEDIQDSILLLYKIHQETRSSVAIQKQLENNQQLQGLLVDLAPYIPNIKDEQIKILIRNLRLLRIKENSIWHTIESHFQKFLELSIVPNEIAELTIAYSVCGRKNTKIWELLTEKVSHLYLSDEFSDYYVIELLMAFHHSQMLNLELFKKLKQNIIKCSSKFHVHSISKLLDILLELPKQEAEFYEILLQKLIENELIIDFSIIAAGLNAAVKFKLNEGYIDKFEELLFKNIQKSNILWLSKISVIYAEAYGGSIKKNSERLKLLYTLENYYANNRSGILSRTTSAIKYQHEANFFWGLAATGNISELDLWKEFLKNKDILIEGNKNKHRVKDIIRILKMKGIT